MCWFAGGQHHQRMAITWDDLARLESAPVTTAVRGRVWSADDPPERVVFAPPDFWRVEDDAGWLRYLASDDGFHQWQPPEGEVACFQPRRPGFWTSGGTTSPSLIRPRGLTNPRDDDFSRPLGAVEEVDFLGRRAWRVLLAPPARKPQPLLQTIDVESGITLAFQSREGRLLAGFTSLETGFEPSADSFTVPGHGRTTRTDFND
jgi:hypothetical protein